MSKASSKESILTHETFPSSSENDLDLDDDLPDVLLIDDVKITPGFVHFENAYEGKRFKQKVVIQNCGKYLAFIRMCNSSSKSFEISSFPQGVYLSAGMKITRVVSYVYRKVLGVQKGFVNIWINDKEITYKFFVSLTQTILSIEPQQVDFGSLDAVNRASSKTFYLKNSGYKGSMFAIDLGRNPLELVVQPMKGVIPAMTSVPITVEIVGSRVGEFIEEIWLKTDPPLRVLVTGTFIEPKIVVRKWISALDFTLINFTTTYYGATTTKPLFIKNFSSSHSMFCVVADVKGTAMTLEEARKVDEQYCNFYVKPIEGRLAALKGAVIQISFRPKLNPKKPKNYAACFLKIIRMDCKDVDTDIYEEADEIVEVSDKPSLTSSRDIHVQQDSTNTIVSFVAADESMTGEHELSFEHSIGVCLHGENETAGVTLRPTFLNLSELTLDKLYQREILVTNKSKILPVKVVYQKVASVDIKPAEFVLAPGDSLEILVTIRTTKLDMIVRKLTFALLARDMPPEKNVVRKVGDAYLKIQFNTSDVVKKPRFDQCVLCRDITAKLESEFPYRLTDMELEKKTKNDNYYLDYIRSVHKRVPAKQSDFLVPKSVSCLKKMSRKSIMYGYDYNKGFLPLPPTLLYNIKIAPKSITLRKVAAHTTISDFFEIENLNTFPIKVFTKSSKSCIVFDELRHVINSKEKKQMVFSFSTTAVGKYNVNINVLINDSTLYEVTAVAQVVPKTLKIESDVIEFSERDGHFKFFRLTNTLNAYTVFTWDVPLGCYKIQPSLGGIQAERSMLCLVTYEPDPSQPLRSECTLTSESGQQRIVNISRKKREPLVVFDNYNIDLGMIPLNICVTKKLVLKNLRKFQSVFRIANNNPIPGIVIEPTEGVLFEFDSQPFTITILLNAVVQFSVELEFVIDEFETIIIPLDGKVAYPNLILKPNVLHFRRMSPCSFDTLTFKVKNSSPCEASISFPFDEYPEFSVSENEDEFTQQSKITLPPQASKVLFLHFFPQYVCTYSLFLPCVINGVLGPARINSSYTHNPLYYLQSNTALYGEVPGVTLLNHQTLLPTIRINSAATDESLTFSKLNIDFVFYGDGHYNNVTSAEFVISNVSKETATVCIRTDDLQAPFSLSPKTDADIEFYTLSFKITLEPDEQMVFEAKFSPTQLGTYVVKLPIFLRHYFDDKIFNYLKMTGVYDFPKIIPVREHYDLEPVPLGLTSDKLMSLNLRNHFEDCRITADSDLIGTNVTLESKPQKGDFLLDLTFHYRTMRSCCYNAEINISCSCKGEATITVTGAVENSIFTTHAYAYELQHKDLKGKNLSDSGSSRFSSSRPKFVNMASNENITCFPLFPADDDHSDYAQHMRSVQKALEYWLYSQGYYMKSYHRLPDGYIDFCKVNKPREERRFGGFKKPEVAELPLIQLITHLAGSSFTNKLVTTDAPDIDDDLGWLKVIYAYRYNTLNYLRGLSAYLPHVKTEYLLNYQQYIMYEKNKHPKGRLLNESTFYRLSRQCHVDLILQIIKVFVFNRVVPIPEESEDDEGELDEKPSLSIERILEPSTTISTENLGEDIRTSGVYGEREKILLNWLQMCYDAEQNTLWSTPACEKEILFFGEDMRDGLILGAVMAHYVPYVRQYIKDMYSKPRTYEELHHNACTLVKTWQLLRFSYVLKPKAIEQGNIVEMLLLVTYLYGILPNYTPRDTRKIEAPLTEKSTVSLQLDNTGDDPIVYEVLFFNNANELFSVDKPTLTIQPQSSKTVKVRYHAKFVESTTTTILFSGETPGQKYGKSIAVKLLGIADLSEACLEIPLSIKLYRPCEISLDLQSPFHVPASYSVFFGTTTACPDDYEKVLYSWEEFKNLKRAKEIILHEDRYQFDANGKMTASPVICVQKIGPRNIWLYFVNPDVGDWGAKIHLKGKVTQESYETVIVTIPENYSQLTCRCKKGKSVTTKCPKLVYIQMPKINRLLWNARKKMILYNVGQGAEMQFWSDIIYTSMGTRILKLIFNSETHPLRQYVPDSKTYYVEVGDPKLFRTLDKVVIDDIISEDCYEFPIHPLKNLLKVKTAELHLTSEDGLETRFYNLCFKRGKAKQTENIVSVI